MGKIDVSNIFILHPAIGFNPATIPLPEVIYFGTLLVIFIICTIGMFSLSNNDAIHTRNKLNFMLLLIITLIILASIFQSQHSSFLPLIALTFALLVSHPFTLKQNNFYGIIFLIFCAINIAYIISKFIYI
jgi:NADH:ubiquinone oxidoreductase subunit 6 (subunit J)